jgi:muramidase (phage lysozyme)
MKIGSRSAARPRTRSYSQTTVVAEDFGSGIGRAIEGLGQELIQTGITRMEIEGMVKERQRKLLRSSADIEFIKTQGAQSRAAMEQTANAEPGAAGITEGINGGMRASFDDFAKRTGIVDDPDLMAEYGERWESFQQGVVTDVFKFEMEESNRKLGEDLNGLIDEGRTNLRNDPTLFDAEFGEITRIIDESPLPPIQKEGLKKQAYDMLAGTVFQKELEMAGNDELPVGPADGSNPVAPGLLPQDVAILNTIAGPESGGAYDIRYNGHGEGDGSQTHFTDFSDHPRIFSQRPDGRWSSAAGRYQFTASTWDATVREMRAAGYEINDFSPVSQDRAALFLAEQRYLAATGRQLREVLGSGDREAIKSVRAVLAPTWEGFEGMSDDAFANMVLGGRGLQRGGTGHSAAPDIWNDPRFAQLSFEDKIGFANAGATYMQETRKAQAAASRQTEEDLTNNLLLKFRNFDNDAEAAANAAVAQGAITDAALIAKIDAQMADSRETMRQAVGIEGDLLSGRTLVPDDREALGSYMEVQGITRGLTELDPTAMQGVVATAAQTGLLPQSVTDIFAQQLSSNDPGAQTYALSALADIFNQRPGALAQSGKEIGETAAFAATLFRYNADPAAALAQFRMMTSPESAPVRERLSKEADTLLAEVGTRDFFKQSTSWWSRNLPQGLTGMPAVRIPDTPEGAMKFTADYETLFKRYYVMHGGDSDKAHDTAGRVMAQTWNANPITGALMENSPLAPGMGVPTIRNDYSWIGPLVEQEAAIAPGTPYTIVSDAETVLDVERLGYPTYRVAVQDEYGQWLLKEGRVPIRPTREIYKGLEKDAEVASTRAKFDRALQLFTEGKIDEAAAVEREARGELDRATAIEEAATPEGQRAEIEAAIRRLDLEEDRVRAEPGAPTGSIPAFETRREELYKMLEGLR